METAGTGARVIILSGSGWLEVDWSSCWPGMGGEKNENEAEGNKMKKKEKGERKKKQGKRGRVIYLLIYGTLLLIIVY